jgi:hypothetical protein
MYGFIVRADGAMISIDHILWIAKEPLPVTNPTEWVIKIYFRDGVSVDWSQSPLMEKEADERLHMVRELLQEAIQL